MVSLPRSNCLQIHPPSPPSSNMEQLPRPAPDNIFVSLGMVVLDEMHLPDGTVLHDVPGGSGLFSQSQQRSDAGHH